MSYPDTVNLPFNSTVIMDSFRTLHPGDQVPPGDGIWVIMQGNALVLTRVNDEYWFWEGPRPAWLDKGCETTLFGTWQGRALYGVMVSRRQELPDGLVSEPFNAMGELLDDRILTLGGLAQQILLWRRHCAICSRCGGGLRPITGTWGMRCTGCGYDHFPHIHPCVIVLVRRGNEYLLARKPEWAAGRYGLVAGFLDLGESLEECVMREVREETGIEVSGIKYVGSQNWPFPSQLMAGFVADYAGGEIRIDHNELEDARWFHVSGLPDALPGKRSIARWIIDRYARGV
jgi:NAD+ diphosphatase